MRENKKKGVMNMKKWLTPWEPLKELEEIRREIDDIFEMRPFRFGLKPLLARSFSPAIDIIDKKDKIVVKAEVPGVDKKDMTISISDDELVIKGEVKREQEVNEKDYYHSERFYGTFSRSIALPAMVDKSKAKASYKDGILEITLPKAESEKSKEVKLEIE
ncbi:MAG: Hsp20/alpha crystallin family protein [candidate division WOR-3 bacterium]